MDTKQYILVSAHQCAPNMGSEHAVGWNLVSRLGRKFPILLVTQDNEYRQSIESGLAELNLQGCRIEAFFVRHGSRTDGRKNSLRLGYYLTYIGYQLRVYRLAKVLLRSRDIRAVHHLNIVGFREPGFLWLLGLPFVWGPVGGLVYTPRKLYAELSSKVKLFQEIRRWITFLQFRFSPRVRLAYRATQKPGGAFIAATPDIGNRFKNQFGGTIHWIPETGASGTDLRLDGSRSTSMHGPLKLLWVGALVDRKPLGMLIEALATLPSHQTRFELMVAGDGDSRQRFEELAKLHAVNAQFVGWCEHGETLQFFRKADLFVLLSVNDLTTNVVFEAIAHGLPVLCLDHHGYSYVITERCGVKIPVTDPAEIRRATAGALDALDRNRNQLADLSRNALERAAEFTWDRNCAAIAQLYQEVS